MKILIVDDEEMIRELITLGLQSHFEVTCLEASSGNAGIQIIKDNPDLDGIICDYRMDNGTGGDVFKFLQSSGSNIPFILCSSDPPDVQPDFKGQVISGYIEKPFTISSIAETFRNVIHPVESSINDKDKKYIKVKIKTLVNLNQLPCDLYIKLSDQKYVKVMRSGDPFGKTDSQHYKGKKIDFLYVERSDLPAFLEYFTKGIASLDEIALFANSPHAIRDIADSITDKNLRDSMISIADALNDLQSETVDLDKALDVSKSTQRVVHEASQRMGFSKEVQALTKANISFALETINRSPTLSRMIEKMLIEKETYISSHSVVLAYLSCGITAMMGWTSELTRYKLAMASFLHDITLKNHQLAQIQTLADLDLVRSDYTPEEIKTYETHPADAAELAYEFKQIPPGVSQIILTHHERPDGAGFPNKIDQTLLSPISSVFIVAHDLVSYIMANEKNGWDLAGYLKQPYLKSWKGNFEKIIDKIKEAEGIEDIEPMTLGDPKIKS